MTPSIQQDGPQRMILEGDLTKETVNALRTAFSRLLTGPDSHFDIDLSNVGHSTSVGLSLLLCCVRDAKKANKTVAYTNMPKELFEMARVSGLDDVLPLASNK